MKASEHILIKNIYYMLSYAFQALSRDGEEDMAPEAFEDMHNLFAAILSKGIGMQLKQGLYREYINRRDDLATLRGRIDMPGTIQNRLARRAMLACEYDELSENNLLNQILKTTSLLLIRHGDVDAQFKDALRHIQGVCKAAGKPSLIYAGSVPAAREDFAMGYDSVAYAMDALVLLEAFKSLRGSLLG